MWEQYRKRFIWVQTLIIVICGFAYFSRSAAPLAVVFVFVMMQGFALVGAAWAARLKSKIEGTKDKLPLE